MLTLIVPGLIWTRQALADLTCDLSLPAFTYLLGKGDLLLQPARSSAAALAEICGVDAPLPAAALRWLALRQHPGATDWLCLDPVRLRLEQRSLMVDDPQGLNLTEGESVSLALDLAPTFESFGRLEMVSPKLWNLQLNAEAPAFQPLPEAIGHHAAPLPPGAAYAGWRHAISEAQVLLHAHPVNRAREDTGRPVVNSVWPWGGGRLPKREEHGGAETHDALWSNDPVAQGIARLLQIGWTELPAAYGASADRNPLAVFEALEQPARSGDALLWREQLQQLEENWLAPAVDALRNGRLDTLHLIMPGDLGSAELQVGRRDLWKFWRKPLALKELAPP